jgi:hypothetical protein
VLTRLCPPHRGGHDRTTETVTLLISVGIPLENTKGPKSVRASALLHAPIHPGAWKKHSRKSAQPRFTTLQLRLENEHAAVEARRRVRLNEEPGQ